MMAFRPDADLESLAAEMLEASQQVSTGEITRATRSVTLDGVEVEEGHYIGLVDGRLCASGSGIEPVLNKVLDGMDTAEREIVSVYYGLEVDEQEAEVLAARINEAYPDVEVELLPGGQAHYFFILGAE